MIVLELAIWIPPYAQIYIVKNKHLHKLISIEYVDMGINRSVCISIIFLFMLSKCQCIMARSSGMFGDI